MFITPEESNNSLWSFLKDDPEKSPNINVKNNIFL
jgi:hypothetical protein